MGDRIIHEDKLIIDVAVLCEEITEMRQTGNDHVVNLDDIYISQEKFKKIFYPNSENFGINCNYINTQQELKTIISFLPEYRSVNKKKFYLLEQILTNLETDLNVPRSCFTVESLVEITHQLTSINSLCDIHMSHTLVSLTWTNIIEIVNNYKLLKNIKTAINPIFSISVIFKTPTNGVENTIIRFNYKITNI
jgi:hypothetical protein